MFLHSTHSSCTECFEKTDKQMDGCVDKQRDWPLLSLLFQAIPFAGAAAACDQREIFLGGAEASVSLRVIIQRVISGSEALRPNTRQRRLLPLP